ncbi:hypothetical protein [Labrenzia sp. PHM005]|uniref:hypothetical protein n=1 Tax=Labrenzia sp. PHM005 TaxID=2590016 RepID=UPI00143D7B6B|nr:hypothetical protein [Labrenzia sp. PHM005]
MFSMRPAYPPGIYALGAVTCLLLLTLHVLRPAGEDQPADHLTTAPFHHILAMELPLD